MPSELTLALPTVYAFLLVLVRIAGVFAFVPFPGLKSGPEPSRAVLACTLTIALYPRWPSITGEVDPGRLAVWVLGEAALGITIGLCVAFAVETLVVAAQIMGLQAGYAYASTIDPNSQADTGVLLVLAQLVAGMLFFALGLDREVIRIFARTLETWPPGSFALSAPAMRQVFDLGGVMLSAALRLALPIVALLVLVDVSLALLGRINAQLQLLTLAFPLKMMLTLLVLGWVAATIPTLFSGVGQRMLTALNAVVGR